MLNNRNVVGIALIVSLLVLLSGCATNAMTRAERESGAYANVCPLSEPDVISVSL